MLVESFLPPSKGVCHLIPCFHPDFKIPQYDCLYNTAAQLATSEFLVYINSDIILFNDFVKALQTSSSQFDDFLMVGRRIDLQYPHLIDYSNPLWRENLQENAIQSGKLHGEYGVDYFAYRRIYSPELPPFLVGRVLWDSYLVAKYIKGQNKTSIDSTKVVFAIHLNHMKVDSLFYCSPFFFLLSLFLFFFFKFLSFFNSFHFFFFLIVFPLLF